MIYVLQQLAFKFGPVTAEVRSEKLLNILLSFKFPT